MRSTIACSQTPETTVSPKSLPDQVKHHVEGRSTPGAGVDGAVDLEEPGPHRRAGEPLGEARIVLPVDDAPLVVEQPRLGQDVRAGAEARDGDRVLPALAQPRLPRLARVALDVAAAADHHHEGPCPAPDGKSLRFDRAVALQRDAAARLRRDSVARDEPPGVGVVSDYCVGEAQGFDGRGEGEKGELGKEIEDELSSRLASFRASKPPSVQPPTAIA